MRPQVPTHHNKMVERKNRLLKDIINVILIVSGLPNNMQGEAILSTFHVLKIMPHKRLDKTPIKCEQDMLLT